MDQGIINYIKKCRELGQSDKDIESFLLKTRHDKADITEALRLADDVSNTKSTSPLAPPTLPPAIGEPGTKAKDKQSQTTPQEKESKKLKKDSVAVMSFVFGLLSILFSSTSFISLAALNYIFGLSSTLFEATSVTPFVALVFGVWGIARTKTKGTGRWMAVVGLVLGILLLISR